MKGGAVSQLFQNSIYSISLELALSRGGWSQFSSEKRIWVPHPCGFCKGGDFDFSALNFLKTGASTFSLCLD
jgi:hypothetical protein